MYAFKRNAIPLQSYDLICLQQSGNKVSWNGALLSSIIVLIEVLKFDYFVALHQHLQDDIQ